MWLNLMWSNPDVYVSACTTSFAALPYTSSRRDMIFSDGVTVLRTLLTPYADSAEL